MRQDLYDITQFIRNDNPRAARETAKLILRRVSEPGTRELAFSPLPSIAVYRVSNRLLKSSASTTVRDNADKVVPAN